MHSGQSGRRAGKTLGVARYLPLALITMGIVVAVLIPAVNRPVLWLGMPPLLLCSAAGVLLLTPALALVEYGHHRHHKGRTENRAESEDG